MASSDRIAVIINPISGTGGRPGVARHRAELAAAVLSRLGATPEVIVTERGGHATEIARALLAQGVATIAAWGGDGTINEVASAVAFTGTRMAIIPSGSGNGLSRELGIPFDPAAALRAAAGPHERLIDAGELDGRLFFNVAGIGLDAQVAHQFAVHGLVRRGFARYLEIAVQEIWSYNASESTVIVDGETLRERALLIAIANGRQYGNGALIAPDARLDDGKLDIVVVAGRPVLSALLQIPRVFMGQVGRVSGVTMRRTAEVEVIAAGPIVYHVDGEPFVGSSSVRGRIRPNALYMKVPNVT